MKALLQLYQDYSERLLELEQSKQNIELVNIDLDSKETMTKLTSKLLKESEEYTSVMNNINHTKHILNILDKKISFARAMIPLFKDYTE